jgi:hypothetical protein
MNKLQEIVDAAFFGVGFREETLDRTLEEGHGPP